MPSLVEFEFVRQRRARTNEAHIATQDVDDLRKLIDAVAADDAPDARDAFVVGEFENLFALVIGAVGRRALPEPNPLLDVFAMRVVAGLASHRAQLEKAEFLAADPDAVLAEKHRAAIF